MSKENKITIKKVIKFEGSLNNLEPALLNIIKNVRAAIQFIRNVKKEKRHLTEKEYLQILSPMGADWCK